MTRSKRTSSKNRNTSQKSKASSRSRGAIKSNHIASCRVDLRIDQESKELFHKAARISGCQNLSSFIISTVKERSKELIEQHNKIILSEKDWKFVLFLLENPPEPGKGLKNAQQAHRDWGFE